MFFIVIKKFKPNTLCFKYCFYLFCMINLLQGFNCMKLLLQMPECYQRTTYNLEKHIFLFFFFKSFIFFSLTSILLSKVDSSPLAMLFVSPLFKIRQCFVKTLKQRYSILFHVNCNEPFDPQSRNILVVLPFFCLKKTETPVTWEKAATWFWISVDDFDKWLHTLDSSV